MRMTLLLPSTLLRIIVMQLTIIFGACVELWSDERGTLALVIAVKTVVDFAIMLRTERDHADAKMRNAADVS